MFVAVYYVDEQCATGWRGYKGHCYFFSSDRKDWDNRKLRFTLRHILAEFYSPV
jgi:hypothetical protein